MYRKYSVIANTAMVKIKETQMSIESVTVKEWKGKNQIRLVVKTFFAGETEIFREQPLAWVREGKYENMSAQWDLVELLLSNSNLRREYIDYNLKSSRLPIWDADDKNILENLAIKYRTARPKIKKIYVSIVTNNITCIYEKHVKRQGYGLFQFLSRANHSCDPSACLAPGDVENGGNAVIALKDLPPGSEITYSYIPKGVLEQNYVTRNLILMIMFGFICECKRCQNEVPASLVGVDQVHYFSDLKGKVSHLPLEDVIELYAQTI